jgi:hypothetical protein
MWFNVNLGNEQSVKQFPNHSLLLIWPDYNKPMASNCLQNFVGELVIYIGEPKGGCNADDAFFNILERDFEQIEDQDIPQWPLVHDHLFVYRRGKQALSGRK